MTIEAIHQSTLGMATRCGEQFRRRYIDNHIIPPGIAAGCGTGVHAGSKVNFRQKIVTKQDLPVSDIQDATRDGFVKAFQNGIYLPKEKKPEKNNIINEGLNKALRLSTLYREAVAPGIQPIATEEPFKIDIGLDLPLAGTMDWQEKAKVDDLKTAGKSWSEGQIFKEIQPVFYSMVHEHEKGVRPDFTYHILVDLKRGPKLQQQTITADQVGKMYGALTLKIKTMIKMLKAGIFMPANPASWWCSADWCGYYETCPYVGNQLPGKEI